ncbi:MAG: prefoldin subunit alpha [Pyrodictiaceae archaeon]
MASNQQVKMTLDEAIAQLSLLEEQIGRLREVLTTTELRISSLTILEDALQNLREGSEDSLIPLDTSGIVYAPAAIKKLDRVIVHAGLDVYVEVSTNKALEIIRGLRTEYSKIAEFYRQELQKLVQYYEGLRAAVEQALARARAQQQPRVQ